MIMRSEEFDALRVFWFFILIITTASVVLNLVACAVLRKTIYRYLFFIYVWLLLPSHFALKCGLQGQTFMYLLFSWAHVIPIMWKWFLLSVLQGSISHWANGIVYQKCSILSWILTFISMYLTLVQPYQINGIFLHGRPIVSIAYSFCNKTFAPMRDPQIPSCIFLST